MASGIPMITTQEGGIADFLFDRERNPEHPPTGWAVDKDSPEQVAKQIQYIMTHPEEVKEVTANASKMIETTYNWEMITKNMKTDVFDKVLKK
jgi:glycosyltransferase involved in cell wall biosynthesis